MPRSNRSRQVDGDHYVKMGIQPWEVIERGKLDYWEACAVKYIMRWRVKDGLVDLDKAIHYIREIKARYKRGQYA